MDRFFEAQHLNSNKNFIIKFFDSRDSIVFLFLLPEINKKEKLCAE